jgi:hypothetical protein
MAKITESSLLVTKFSTEPDVGILPELGVVLIAY